MKAITYPLQLSFKIATFANDFVAKDANGHTVYYVRQKMFKLIDEVIVFSDDSKTTQLYSIKANKWLDFSATYSFFDAQGKELGKVARKGWASLWKSRYELLDEAGNPDLSIQEESPWVKVMDALLSEVPLMGLFSGYFFNPSYTVKRPDGTLVVRLKKKASFFGRHFSLNKIAEFEAGEEERVMLGMMMMILMERRRG
jgi:uncharacterized protein YxjI